MIDHNSITYYDARAEEYEDVYKKPERRTDLDLLKRHISAVFTQLDVLEVACGTGYWTQFIARSARSIVAVDVNESVLNIARKKSYGTCPVTFLRNDVYSLEKAPFSSSAGFHAFWWSHIPLQDIPRFLQSFHSRLQDDSQVIMIDKGMT